MKNKTQPILIPLIVLLMLIAAVGVSAAGGPPDPRQDLTATPTPVPEPFNLERLFFATLLNGAGTTKIEQTAFAPDGGIFVAGEVGRELFEPDWRYGPTSDRISRRYYLAKLAPDGSAVEFVTVLQSEDRFALVDLDVDAAGNPYLAFNMNDTFIVTPGAYRTIVPTDTWNGGYVYKFSGMSGEMIYGAYTGAGIEAIAVNANGELYAVGETRFFNFPITPGTISEYAPSSQGSRSYVMKLNASGSNLIYSTVLQRESQRSDVGGPAFDIEVDAFDNVIVTGENPIDTFATTPGAYFQDGARFKYAYLIKISPDGRQPLFASMIGTETSSAGIDVAFGPDGSVYLLASGGDGFPETGTLTGAPSENSLFLTKFSPDGGQLIYSMRLPDRFRPNVLTVSPSGTLYLGGRAESPDLPVSDDAFDTTCIPVPTDPVRCDDGYLMQVDGATGTLQYSTYLGGRGGDTILDIAVDADERVLAVGQSGSPELPGTTVLSAIGVSRERLIFGFAMLFGFGDELPPPLPTPTPSPTPAFALTSTLEEGDALLQGERLAGLDLGPVNGLQDTVIAEALSPNSDEARGLMRMIEVLGLTGHHLELNRLEATLFVESAVAELDPLFDLEASLEAQIAAADPNAGWLPVAVFAERVIGKKNRERQEAWRFVAEGYGQESAVAVDAALFDRGQQIRAGTEADGGIPIALIDTLVADRFVQTEAVYSEIAVTMIDPDRFGEDAAVLEESALLEAAYTQQIDALQGAGSGEADAISAEPGSAAWLAQLQTSGLSTYFGREAALFGGQVRLCTIEQATYRLSPPREGCGVAPTDEAGTLEISPEAGESLLGLAPAIAALNDAFGARDAAALEAAFQRLVDLEGTLSNQLVEGINRAAAEGDWGQVERLLLLDRQVDLEMILIAHAVAQASLAPSALAASMAELSAAEERLAASFGSAAAADGPETADLQTESGADAAVAPDPETGSASVPWLWLLIGGIGVIGLVILVVHRFVPFLPSVLTDPLLLNLSPGELGGIGLALIGGIGLIAFSQSRAAVEAEPSLVAVAVSTPIDFGPQPTRVLLQIAAVSDESAPLEATPESPVVGELSDDVPDVAAATPQPLETPLPSATPTTTPTPSMTPTLPPIDLGGLETIPGLSLGLSPSELAERGGGSGQLAFSSNRDGDFDIYLTDEAGQVRRVLDTPGIDEFNPILSPNGRKILYHALNGSQWELYEVSVEGGTPVNLTNHPSDDTFGVYSPDGNSIAFHSNRNGQFDIFVLDVRSGGLTNVVSGSDADVGPTWSPDGEKIAYYKFLDGDVEEIYMYDLNTGVETQLTFLGQSSKYPVWSPEGRIIAFFSEEGSESDIWFVDTESLVAGRLTDGSYRAFFPKWSPNGDWIIYHGATTATNRDIYLYSFESGEQIQLTTTGEEERLPSWVP